MLVLGAYDAVLGFEWLKKHNPMQCHWAKKKLEFVDEGVSVSLQGLQQPLVELAEISDDQLCKWLKGNDVWALDILEYQSSGSQQNVSTVVQTVWDEFKDIFEDPKVLPPSRTYDHTIPLIPEAVPVNIRP